MTHEMRHNKMLHTESRVAQLFEINAVRRDPVNIDVIPLKYDPLGLAVSWLITTYLGRNLGASLLSKRALEYCHHIPRTTLNHVRIKNVNQLPVLPPEPIDFVIERL